MGYRSSGKLAMETKVIDKLRVAGATPETFLKDCASCIKGEYTVFSYTDWKMYDSFPEVSAFNKFMCMLNEKDIEFDYIRVGEDEGDIETNGHAGWLYVSTIIEVCLSSTVIEARL